MQIRIDVTRFYNYVIIDWQNLVSSAELFEALGLLIGTFGFQSAQNLISGNYRNRELWMVEQVLSSLPNDCWVVSHEERKNISIEKKLGGTHEVEL